MIFVFHLLLFYINFRTCGKTGKISNKSCLKQLKDMMLSTFCKKLEENILNFFSIFKLHLYTFTNFSEPVAKLFCMRKDSSGKMSNKPCFIQLKAMVLNSFCEKLERENFFNFLQFSNFIFQIRKKFQNLRQHFFAWIEGFIYILQNVK